MPKLLRAGGEVDSWCTKCRLFLNHRIIAMVGPKPARVECSTCGSHHNYRAAAPGEKPETSAKSNATRVANTPATRAPRAPSKAEQERQSLERSWEKAVSGKSPKDFKNYRVTQTFQSGELVHHAKFGDGVVTKIVDAHKVEILFKDEHKTLAQGLAD